MNIRRSFVVMVLLSVVFAGPLAAGDGWSLSSLNPFKKASPQNRARASVSDESARKSGFPRMSLPSWKSESRSPKRPSEPSTFAKLSQGTQDLFGKTKDMLTPWSTTTKKSSASKGRSSSNRSFFTSWLPQKKQPKKDNRTVKDFLAQPRPGF